MRALLLPLLVALTARGVRAQASVASELWRVAEGTLIVPAALADDGTGAFWTPAVSLAPDERYRMGLEAVYAPTEIGVSGGLFGFSVRAGSLGTVNLTYGRLGIGSVGYTETSPEIVGGSAVEIYNQTASIGLAGHIGRGLTGGLALRYLSGRMGFESHEQVGVDFGAQYVFSPRVRVGASTRFLDPTFGDNTDATTYSLGAEARSRTLDAWGTPATVVVRAGLQASGTDEHSQLLTAGFTFGGVLAVDAGAAHESTPADEVWRTRLGVGFSARQFAARIARDGGVNGFGATYRFSLTATFR